MPQHKKTKKTSTKRRKGSSSTGKAAGPKRIRIALAQMNAVVGDFKLNIKKAKSALKEAKKYQADLILFPELFLPGYPPEDLLLKKGFVKKNCEALQLVVPHTRGITALLGFAEPDKAGQLYNSAALAANGKMLGSYKKICLPNYGVFDEKRYFTEGSALARFTQGEITFGITVCEDIWFADGPGKALCGEGGVDVLLNISSSPYYRGKGKTRCEMIRQRAKKYRTHMVYANLVGGQDELVFDGQSLVISPRGEVLARGNSFEEELIFVDLKIRSKSRPVRKKSASSVKIKTYRIARSAMTPEPKQEPSSRPISVLGEVEEIYRALVLGTRDYMVKNGFSRAVIGLSGGIDSALTAVIATNALGPENVVGVLMPSPFSSKGSVDDVMELSCNLGIETLNLPIDEAMRAYDRILSEAFKNRPPNIAEENLQARIRGNLLMALSNKMGWLVLTTGNKSEFSMGYCTLYGDMAGGFAVIKDVPKTLVYKLCEWLNRDRENAPIPQSILTKEPTAELRPDQKDTDNLPPYPVLDPVLSRYVEEDSGLEELKNLGLSGNEILRVVRMVDANEYKRRQGPPGIKITPKAFGKDRRLPITNRFEP